MSNPMERYLELDLKESLPKIHRYPFACTELSFIIRHAYSKLPKNIQSLLFQDTLSAFRLLPEMQMQSAISAANQLHQSAEAALPKQKRGLAIAEFKHAKIACKRRTQSLQEVEGSAQLPQDVIVHIFSFLDFHSLIAVALVCWSWNLAAREDSLWQFQYQCFFGKGSSCSTVNLQQIALLQNGKDLREGIAASNSIDWRDAFKRAYTGNPSKKFASCRGYCEYCKTIVWLNNMKCSNSDQKENSLRHQIKHVSSQQVVEYLLDKNPFLVASSDSDSDSDEGSFSKLWAYPRQISGCKKPQF